MIGLLLFTFLIGVQTGPLNTPVFSPEKVTWNSLSFHAEKWGMEASSNVRLSPQKPNQLPSGPLLPDGKPLIPSQLALLSMSSNQLGTNSSLSTWFDPQSGTVYTTTKLNTGRKNYRKIYRYHQEGVFLKRNEPTSRNQKSPDDWAKEETQFNPIPKELRAVSEIPVILYLIAASNLTKKGDQFEVTVWSGKELLTLHCRVESQKHKTMSWLDSGSQKKINGARVLLDIVIQGRPLEADKKASFSLLGLKDTLHLLLDLKTRTPLRLSGEAPIVGKLDVNLIKAGYTVALSE